MLQALSMKCLQNKKAMKNKRVFHGFFVVIKDNYSQSD